jgi:hypothetical protein
MEQRIKHLARLLTGGGVIQIDQGLTQTSHLRQQRKILPGQGSQVVGSPAKPTGS